MGRAEARERVGDQMANDVDAVDFFRGDADELLVDPYSYLEKMRELCPVHREPHHDVVMVTGFAEAREVYNDTATYSSANSVSGPFPGFPVPLVGDDVSDLIEEYRDQLPLSDQIIVFDPPKHTDHRALMLRLLTPKRLKENEDLMWSLVDRHLDPFIPDGRCDFIAAYASPFTLAIIGDLLGVPDGDKEAFRRDLQGGQDDDHTIGSTEVAISHNPLEALYNRFSAYIEERRSKPRNDVLSGMAAATFPDGTVPDVGDVARVAVNVFAAGQETTVRFLGAALQILGDNPELQQALRDDRSLIPNFVEETLRLEAPVKGDFRVARTARQVGGVDVPAGSCVMVLNGAANRDPRQFERPNEFDVTRDNARHHIAFGYGVHTCPGAPLARTEGVVSITRVLDRMGNIRISEEHHGPAGQRRYSYVPTFILRGLTELHIEFDPLD
jgi:cytochrome P450